MHFKVITLFPEVFPGCLGISVLGRAKSSGLWSLDVVSLRDFAKKGGHVDDTPYGGGPGMVIRPDVLGSAIESATLGDWKDAKVFF